LSTVAKGLITFYQVFLSFDTGILRLLAPTGGCRYDVRCSEYTKQMIDKEGLIKGIYKGMRRIITCR
jgi:uncharacterized protein